MGRWGKDLFGWAVFDLSEGGAKQILLYFCSGIRFTRFIQITQSILLMGAVEILEFLKENKPMFQQSMGVKNIGLFGSYAKGLAGPDSDIDIFVEMPPDFSSIMQLQQYLEVNLGQSIDLLRKGPHLRPDFLKTIASEIIYA